MWVGGRCVVSDVEDENEMMFACVKVEDHGKSLCGTRGRNGRASLRVLVSDEDGGRVAADDNASHAQPSFPTQKEAAHTAGCRTATGGGAWDGGLVCSGV